MIKKNDEIELNIEKLTYRGLALGRCFSGDTPNGFVVFVKNALSKDKVKVKITKVNKHYAYGEIIEIISPSPRRQKPFCPLFNACGACSFQHAEYDFLVKEKNNMLKEAFLQLDYEVEFLEPIKSPADRQYRHKVQYRISETKNSKRLLAGYFREKTHDIVNIKFCPIQPRIADEAVEFLRENWKLGGYVEKTHKGLLKSFIIRFSSDLKSALVTLVLNSSRDNWETIRQDVEDFAKSMKERFSEIKGVAVNFNPDKTNCILTDDYGYLDGENSIVETLLSEDGTKRNYKISHDSFFQVNPKCAARIFDEVKRNVKEGSTVLDAYGGVGAIGIWLSDKAHKICLVEENRSATDDAKYNFKLNGCKNYEVFLGDAKERFREFLKEKRKFTHVIIDPPRKGSDNEALEALAKLTDSIIYVSCNPQTLVRDIKYLQTLGFRAKTTRAADMFPYSYHIESVTVIERG